jgi:transposase-like protein
MEEQRARTRRSFTDEFKRDAVAMVLDDGNQIAEEFGVTRPTIYRHLQARPA